MQVFAQTSQSLFGLRGKHVTKSSLYGRGRYTYSSSSTDNYLSESFRHIVFPFLKRHTELIRAAFESLLPLVSERYLWATDKKVYLYWVFPPLFCCCKWSVRRTWIAQQWPFMWMRSTANHAMARNMDQKAMALEVELVLWVWTQEKDLESSLKCEQEQHFYEHHQAILYTLGTFHMFWTRTKLLLHVLRDETLKRIHISVFSLRDIVCFLPKLALLSSIKLCFFSWQTRPSSPYK